MNYSGVLNRAPFSSDAGACAKPAWHCRPEGKAEVRRVIYLYLPDAHVLYLFLLFKKSDTANLSKAQRNQRGSLAEQIKYCHAQKKQNP
jgi:hypothetical protein